ncbi:hypothetical protein HYQ41_00810 [Facklamia sp. DSM 111019]|nr:hypothetical protein [Facklamia lactis]
MAQYSLHFLYQTLSIALKNTEEEIGLSSLMHEYSRFVKHYPSLYEYS